MVNTPEEVMLVVIPLAPVTAKVALHPGLQLFPEESVMAPKVPQQLEFTVTRWSQPDPPELSMYNPEPKPMVFMFSNRGPGVVLQHVGAHKSELLGSAGSLPWLTSKAL